MHLCPCCDCTEVVPHGKLGRHDYVKCRDCGIEYSTYVENEEWDESWEESDDEDSDHLDRFADAEALASAGFGTDEDYGHFGGDD